MDFSHSTEVDIDFRIYTKAQTVGMLGYLDVGILGWKVNEDSNFGLGAINNPNILSSQHRNSKFAP